MSDKIKTLSQAIRLGATFRPQCRFTLFKNNDQGQLASCAFGAAYEALTGYTSENHETWLYPHRHPTEVVRERFNLAPSTVYEVIERNNGTNGHAPQSREEIADWLESQGL